MGWPVRKSETLTLTNVNNTLIVSFFDVNNPSMSAWKRLYMNRKVRITKKGVTFTAIIKDTCQDYDTSNKDC